jgi:hypothetical protein
MFDPLGFPSDLEYLPPAFGEHVYFDRDDVKEALHAPNTTWAECNGNAFNSSAAPDTPYGDTSLDSHINVLPRVIDATQRVLIAGGDYDMEIISLGTLLGIQNMTWGGKLGFQTQPGEEEIVLELPDLTYNQVYIDSGFEGYDQPGQGLMGTQHFERGLMWATTRQSGHMQPQVSSPTAIDIEDFDNSCSSSRGLVIDICSGYWGRLTSCSWWRRRSYVRTAREYNNFIETKMALEVYCLYSIEELPTQSDTRLDSVRDAGRYK